MVWDIKGSSYESWLATKSIVEQWWNL